MVDFYPPYPIKKDYHHYNGVNSYKFDYSQMFLWNPNYFMVSHQLKLSDRNIKSVVIDKNERISYSTLVKGYGDDNNYSF